MSSPEYTGLCKLLYDWQTIVAALLAILAAIIATFPVWQQLTGSSGGSWNWRLAKPLSCAWPPWN